MLADRAAIDSIWSRTPLGLLDPERIESLVTWHCHEVVASVAASPPIGSIYALALNPSSERYDATKDVYAYGLEADRERFLAADDLISVWNATLFNQYFEAVNLVTPQEQTARSDLLNQQEANFDYWLLSEVARRLNDEGFRPVGATSDFVTYYMDAGLSVDFSFALAYTTPPPTYRSLVDRHLASADVDPGYFFKTSPTARAA